MAAHLAPIAPVDDRIEAMRNALKESSEARDYFPGLDKLLTKYLENSSFNPQQDSVDKESFIRGMLRCFYKTQKDDTYSKTLSTYSPQEQDNIRAFVENKDSADQIGERFVPGLSPAVREEVDALKAASKPEVEKENVEGGPILHENPKDVTDSHHGIFHWFKTKFLEHGTDAEKVLVPHQDMDFNNWGYTVNNKPRFTYTPRSVKGVQAIVNFAISQNMSVRVSGYRHSWSPIFGRNGQVLISMINIRDATKLPNIASLPLPESKPTELESIELVGATRPGGKRLVRVGSAVTNERFRRWCKKEGKVTLPLNVIMVEITLGGSNGPICHGAGKEHKTLSDLVKRIEYIDAHGKARVIEESDARFLKAASGCFGLIGVITHLTLEVDPMTYAEMWPSKIPILLAIPPPPGENVAVPTAFETARDQYLKETNNKKPLDQIMREAQDDFERRANEDYYAEWFWFPYSDYVWINTWKNTTDDSDVVDYPSNGRIFLQWTETVLMNIFQNIPFQDKVVSWFKIDQPLTTLISKSAMLALPERVPGKSGDAGKPIKTTVADALHFQRAIQNVRVRDMEVEMPLVPKASNFNQVDYTIVQRAWWDAIAITYQNAKTCPMRMPLEMRIFGGSDVIMAPQRGNNLGTCAIEVLTLESCKDIWLPFAQQVLDKWMGYTHNGKELRTRPHWAKEWAVRQTSGKESKAETLNVNGRPWFEKVKSDAAEDIREFNEILAEIGKRDQWTRNDIKQRFSNDLLDQLYFDDLK